MKAWQQLFGDQKAVIGMIHVPALPGSPLYAWDTGRIFDQVASEAAQYAAGGVDAVMIENMHDVPYLKGGGGAEVTAFMTRVGMIVKEVCKLPCGVQVLAGGNQQAIAIAFAAGPDFVRAEGFVFGHVADEGWMDADAGTLLRYRKAIGAEHIMVLCDIKKKHSAHAITADVDLAETAKAAQFFLSDGVILTGTSTGAPLDPAHAASVKGQVNLPIIAGSGMSPDNLADLWPHLDGFIVGSYFKEQGYWENPLDPERIGSFMQEVARLRTQKGPI